MLNFQNCELECGYLGRGVRIYTLFGDQTCPWGMVWGVSYIAADERRVFHVHGSNVPCEYKRQGVRTQINRMLANEFDTIITSGASNEGKAFMVASGYKLDDATGFWAKQFKEQKNVRSKRRK